MYLQNNPRGSKAEESGNTHMNILVCFLNIYIFYSMIQRIAKFVARKLSQKWPRPGIVHNWSV